MSTVWVVSKDDGCEGLSSPDCVFLTEDEARAYAEHMGRAGYSHYAVNQANVMRFTPAQISPAELGRLATP